MEQPREARARHVAWPIPPVAPVMSARWGLRSVRRGLGVDMVILNGGGELGKEWTGERDELMSDTTAWRASNVRYKHDIVCSNQNK
jgi:hypothetical protein